MPCSFNERTKFELSIPPDKNAPTGTSEANLELVAFLSLSIISSLALSYVPLNGFLSFLKIQICIPVFINFYFFIKVIF